MSATVTTQVHLAVGRRNKSELRVGLRPEKRAALEGRVPRVSRLMALAIKFDRLIAEGEIEDQTELARLGHVTRARVTQIMNLLHLAPDIQEAILHLPPVKQGKDPICERDLRSVAARICWGEQRKVWRKVIAQSSYSGF